MSPSATDGGRPPGLVPGFVHPERLAGEPDRRSPRPALLAPWLVARALLVAVAVTLAAPLWPLLWLTTAIWGHPPTAARLGQGFYYLGLIWHRSLPAPGLSALERLWFSVSVVKYMGLAPVFGLAWHLDELIYGRALSAVPVVAPIVMISAARSGSTQLSHYIEADPRVVAPNALQILAPYLWLWRLAAPTLGRLLGPERVRALLYRLMLPEYIERHEVEPFATDTFELALYLRHLNHLAFYTGPDNVLAEFSIVPGQPSTARLWRETLPELIDRVGRKTLLFAGAGPDTRLFVKGHFLAAADAVAERWPDARFLTMVRRPSKRLQSMINFLRCSPVEPTMLRPPWPWVVEGLSRSEPVYNAVEHAWFTRPEGPRRTALRFTDYVADLEGTLRRVYAECFDAELPEHAPRRHTPRERQRYAVDRSLEQLGLDGAAIDAAQAAYVAWCEAGQGSPAAPE